MCDQTMPYEFGTLVWVKLINSVWWPGRVVDISTIPEEIQEYVNKKKKNYKAIVFIESEEYYEAVVNINNVCLYSSAKKLEFVEKGYSLFLKHKAGKPVKIRFKMQSFVSDIVQIEEEIGGDTNIFIQFEKKNEVARPSVNIKELFVSEKDLKKRKKAEMRRRTYKPLVSKQETPTTSSSTRFISSTQEKDIGYKCEVTTCTFRAEKFDLFKQHMLHKHTSVDYDEKAPLSSINRFVTNANISNIIASPPTKKRKNNNKKANNQNQKPDKKKVKLLDELLKDWDDDDDENERALSNNTGTKISPVYNYKRSYFSGMITDDTDEEGNSCSLIALTGNIFEQKFHSEVSLNN